MSTRTDAAARRPAAAPAEPHVGTFASLANRDFRFLLGGTMGTQVGMWAQTIGQGLLVYSLTRSALQLGLISFIRGLSMLIASPFGGLVCDTWDRRRVVISGTLLAALNAVILSALVSTGTVEVWHLYIIAAIDGGLSAINQPARQALVYDVAGEHELTNAVALSSVGSNIMRIIGPSLSGALVGVAGIAACFIFQAACYVVSAVISVFIRPVQQGVRKATSLSESLLGGFTYARSHRVVLLLLICSAVPSAFVYPYVGFVPVFAKEVLHASDFKYGVLMTAVGVGSIPGAFAAANMTAMPRKGRMLLLTTGGYVAMIAVFALMQMYWLAWACLVLAGVSNAIQNTLNATLIQFAVSDEYRGRVSALYFMTGGLTPFGSLLMGALIAAYGAPLVVAAFAGVATAAVVVLGILSPRLRAL